MLRTTWVSVAGFSAGKSNHTGDFRQKGGITNSLEGLEERALCWISGNDSQNVAELICQEGSHLSHIQGGGTQKAATGTVDLMNIVAAIRWSECGQKAGNICLHAGMSSLATATSSADP